MTILTRSLDSFRAASAKPNRFPIAAAIEPPEMPVEGLVVTDKPYLDIGTPEDLFQAVNVFSRI